MSYLEVSVPTIPQIFILNLAYNVAYVEYTWSENAKAFANLTYVTQMCTVDDRSTAETLSRYIVTNDAI
jgi:hypothetical protein